MPPTLKKLGGNFALGLFVCQAFETSHIFGTMYARILKFCICIAYEKLPDPFFFFVFFFLFCQILHGELVPFWDLGILGMKIL